MWFSFVLCWGQLRFCLRNLGVSNTIFLTVLTTLHIRSAGILKTGFWIDTCLIIWVLLNHRITFLSGLVLTSTRKECSFVTSRLSVYNSDLHGLGIKSFSTKFECLLPMHPQTFEVHVSFFLTVLGTLFLSVWWLWFYYSVNQLIGIVGDNISDLEFEVDKSLFTRIFL